MANELDELTGPVNPAGNDVNVIQKQLPVTIGVGSVIFELVLWCIGILPGIICLLMKLEGNFEASYLVVAIIAVVCLMVPLIFQLMKTNARNYFRQLQQKIQADASRIDNYLEQRVQILQNVAPLVAKAIDLDKDVMKAIAAFRGGHSLDDATRNDLGQQLNASFGRMFPQVEAYPELKAHQTIVNAMQQNAYLQREITAARELYNDTVAQWNTDIFDWPAKQIVAARAGFTTRIPFSVSADVKARARETFF